MSRISFENVGKIYADGTRAVEDLNLEIDDGEFVVFVGPSGCGKTTALRMVAGLEAISEGVIRVGDDVINMVEPRRRDVAMIFQNYALYPHMSIYDNIAFPLRSRRLDKAEIRERVERAATMLDLTEHLKRRPKNLSGGQRQRVAMGRAIVREPKAFLMDEPLSNLDAKLRVQMRAEISRLQRELGVTTIYVTHDQVEAMTMAARIAVMRKGVLQQHGTPQEVYERPANLFVATFVGSPGMNLFRARVAFDASEFAVVVGDQRLLLAPSVLDRHANLSMYAGREIVLGIRPEHLGSAAVDATLPRVSGQVQLVEMLGSERLVHLEVTGDPVLADEVLEIASDIDSAVVQTLEHDALEHKVAVVARVIDSRVKVEAGDVASFTVDPDHMHFFDCKTGVAIT